MSQKFLSLKPEKQVRILNATMKEFVQKGFKNASTDEMVKEANISKGSLFHYFGNKKGLFLFLYDYSVEMVIKEFFEKIDLNETDILVRLRQMMLLKIDLMRKYPDMFAFIRGAYFEESGDVKHDLERKNKEIYAKHYNQLFQNIDSTKFKEGLEIRRAINIIIWTMEGFATTEREKARSLPFHELDYQQRIAEMDIYVEMLRNCLYK